MNIFGGRKRETKSALKRVDGAAIRYATSRNSDGSERILGRKGRVNLIDDRVTLLCDGKSVFSCSVNEVSCSELLSGDGAIFSGVDCDSGQHMTVVAYFTSPIH